MKLKSWNYCSKNKYNQLNYNDNQLRYQSQTIINRMQSIKQRITINWNSLWLLCDTHNQLVQKLETID